MAVWGIKQLDFSMQNWCAFEMKSTPATRYTSMCGGFYSRPVKFVFNLIILILKSTKLWTTWNNNQMKDWKLSNHLINLWDDSKVYDHQNTDFKTKKKLTGRQSIPPFKSVSMNIPLKSSSFIRKTELKFSSFFNVVQSKSCISKEKVPENFQPDMYPGGKFTSFFTFLGLLMWNHTVNALLFNFCKFDQNKSRKTENCTVLISKLYCNGRYSTVLKKYSL